MSKAILVVLTLLLIGACEYPHPNMLPFKSKKGDKKYDKPIFTDTLLAMPFYTISYDSQQYPRCHKKGFCVLLPLLRKSDFVAPNKGWSLMSYDKGFVVYTELADGWMQYHIEFSTSHGKVGEYERAVMRRDKAYFDRRHKKYNFSKTSKTSFATIGKERYPCLVFEQHNPRFKIKDTTIRSYGCYKFNPAQTEYKKVIIKLIYHRSPKLPDKYRYLTKIYTFEDLKHRAQRTLDSLYIKSWW